MIFFLHFFFSGIGALLVYVVRIINMTAVEGDKILQILRVLSPVFAVCNAAIFESNG
jgi:hypothetical protein